MKPCSPRRRDIKLVVTVAVLAGLLLKLSDVMTSLHLSPAARALTSADKSHRFEVNVTPIGSTETTTRGARELKPESAISLKRPSEKNFSSSTVSRTQTSLPDIPSTSALNQSESYASETKSKAWKTSQNFHAGADLNRKTVSAQSARKDTGELNLEDWHYQMNRNTSEGKSGPKYLIYYCNGVRNSCGGLADRLKGIIYAYILARLTNRNLGIYVVLPGCEFSDFLRVNRLDWKFDQANVEEKNLTTMDYDRVNRFSFGSELNRMNYHKFFGDTDIVFFKSNLQRLGMLLTNPHHAHELRWLAGYNNSAIYRAVIRHLFTLTPPLQRQVDDVVLKARSRSDEQKPGRLVCAQIRLGANPTIPDDSNIRLTDEDLQAIWKFLAAYHSDSTVSYFVATDSVHVLKTARRMFGTRLLEVTGPIVHVDRPRQTDDVCSGMRRALVDMYVMTQCDVLLLTHSGLGDLAAALRGKQDGLFRLDIRPAKKGIHPHVP